MRKLILIIAVLSLASPAMAMAKPHHHHKPVVHHKHHRGGTFRSHVVAATDPTATTTTTTTTTPVTDTTVAPVDPTTTTTTVDSTTAVPVAPAPVLADPLTVDAAQGDAQNYVVGDWFPMVWMAGTITANCTASDNYTESCAIVSNYAMTDHVRQCWGTVNVVEDSTTAEVAVTGAPDGCVGI